ncbi:ribonuclease H-like domain-containing protein [Tanacetum coccineum]
MLSDDLQARLVVKHPRSTKAAWDLLTEIVKDNKRSRTIALKAELRSLKLGDLSMDAYFRKIESIATILTSLGSSVSSEDVVNFSLEGLPDKYDHVCGIMHHRDTFPDLKTARSMLTTEEMRLKSKAHSLPVDSFSSSPMVLMAESCSCRFGNECKFVHDVNVKPRGDMHDTGNNTDALLLKLLGNLGINDTLEPNNSTVNNQSTTPPQHITISTLNVNPVAFHATASPTTIPPGLIYYVPSAQQLSPVPQPVNYVSVPPGFTYPSAQHLSLPAAHSGSTGPTVTPGQETTLPHAFTAGTLHDPTTGAWNMDTGVTSHLNDSITSLSEVFNTCIYPSVLVGDGYSIPVTNTGNSILPTPFRPLHLQNVLITPHIVKNLISVRQFIRDNNYVVEFDAFGFSVKDFMTRRVLL